MTQSDAFLSGEGDAWYARNKDKLGQRDPVCDLLNLLPLIRPKRVFEVGCANGWRLKKLRDKYKCRVSGMEPSYDAYVQAMADGLEDVSWGAFPRNDPWLGGTFDMIIFGFCLYVASPSDWFKIVTEADRLLADKGHLIIHDFPVEDVPFARKYEHKAGLLSYHVDFAKLWLAHPWYTAYDESTGPDGKVTILQKDVNALQVHP